MYLFSRFERLVGFRYLRSRRKEGFVSVIAGFSFLGICLGVATLIIVMSVMNGFRQELLTRILGLNGHLGIYGISGEYIEDYEEKMKKISLLPEVKQVMPIIEGQVMISSDYGSSGALLRGIDFKLLSKENIIIKGIKDIGRIDLSKEGVIIGDKLARRLGVFPGDEITLISSQGIVTAFGSLPRMKSYEVLSTFSVGMFEYDSNFIFMPLSFAQEYFGSGSKVSNLEIFLIKEDLLSRVKPVIGAIIGSDNRLQDWERSNEVFFNALEVERNVMFLILMLIIIVASFNMVSGLIMLVKDKGKEVGILRTMGASRGSIMRLFFISGATVGILGTFAGLFLGLLFCFNIEGIRQFLQTLTGTELFSAEIYFLSQIPAETDIKEVIFVVLMSLGLTFISTLYPSWRAARLDPVEVLRYE